MHDLQAKEDVIESKAKTLTFEMAGHNEDIATSAEQLSHTVT